MVLSLAIFLALGQTINFEPEGARMEVLLRDLSVKLGRTLTPSPELRDDVLVISARDVSPEDLLAKMAEAVEATWERKSEKWILTRTPEQRKVRTERTKRQTIEWIRRAKEALDRSTPSAPALSEKEAEDVVRSASILERGQANVDTFSDRRMPIPRAVEALVAQMTPEALAEMPLGNRVVFSSKPNKMQRPFPTKVDGILTDLRSQFAMLEASLLKQPKFDRKNYTLWPYYYMLLPPGKRVEKILLVAKREPSSISLRTLVVDQDGLDLSVAGPVVSNLSRLDVSSTSNAALPNTPVELSQATQAWLRLTQSAYGPPDHSLDLSSSVRQCATRDPLGLIFTEGARAYSRALKRSVVLALTDGCLADALLTTRMAKLTVRSFGRMVKTAPMEPTDRGGWLVGKQPYPDYSAYDRLDRKSIEDLAKAYDAEGTVTLAAAAAFATRQPEGAWTGLLSRLLSRLGPGIEISMYSLPLLRVYGLAPASQKMGMTAGRSYRMAELSNAQQAAMRNSIFNQMNWENELRLDQTQFEYVPVVDLQAAGLRADITEMLPNGIPHDAPIRLTVTTKGIAFMKRPDGRTTANTPSTMAYTVWQARQNATENKLLFKPAEQSTWDLEIGINRLISKHFVYNENRAPGEWAPLSSLPKTLIDELETMMKGYSQRDGGAGRKPPPR